MLFLDEIIDGKQWTKGIHRIVSQLQRVSAGPCQGVSAIRRIAPLVKVEAKPPFLFGLLAGRRKLSFSLVQLDGLLVFL